MRAAIALLLITATACSPAQRMALGAGVGALGLMVSSAEAESLAQPCREHSEPDHTCVDPNKTNTGAGVAVVLGGLGVAAVGGVILATADSGGADTSRIRSDAPPPPETPAHLDKGDAVGMAVGEMVVVGIGGNRRPRRLQEVDGAHSTLNVDGARAELSNLRVHVAPDGSWLTLRACYEYASDWQLTSLGTSPTCFPKQ